MTLVPLPGTPSPARRPPAPELGSRPTRVWVLLRSLKENRLHWASASDGSGCSPGPLTDPSPPPPRPPAVPRAVGAGAPRPPRVFLPPQPSTARPPSSWNAPGLALPRLSLAFRISFQVPVKPVIFLALGTLTHTLPSKTAGKGSSLFTEAA